MLAPLAVPGNLGVHDKFMNRKENIKMELSARNQLKGTVKKVQHGAVNSEVTIELADGIEVVSIITKDSAEQLELLAGKAVLVVIKASDVMIGTE
jgi:molybdopterin-binding protein